MNSSNGPILIVEDVPNVLELLEVTLRFKGYAVITARNGEEALEVISQQRPVLIITDILMPKMDGYEMVQLLRREQTGNRARIIGVSSSGALDARTKAFRTMCDTFLTKPFMPNELVEKLNCLA